MDVYTPLPQTLTLKGKKIRITIPAGIEDQQTIKIIGHVGPGRGGGPSGDLYITFNILNNTAFQREGEHLYKAVEIPLTTAVLGGEITLDTLKGKVKLKVKPGTQNGTRVKLSGKGFPRYKKEGQFGDLFITYNVRIPIRLTPEQKSCSRNWQKTKCKTRS